VKLLSKKGRHMCKFSIFAKCGFTYGHKCIAHERCSSNQPKLWCVEDICSVMRLQKEFSRSSKNKQFYSHRTKISPLPLPCLFLAAYTQSKHWTHYASGQKNLLIYAWNRGRVWRAKLLVAKSSDCPAQLFSYVYVRICAQCLILSLTLHTKTLLLAHIIKMNFGELTKVFVGLCGQIQRDKDELGGIFMRKTEHFKVQVDDNTTPEWAHTACSLRSN